MNRVSSLISLLLLAASLPAAANGKDVIREALSRAQGSSSSAPSQPRAQPQPQQQPVRHQEQRAQLQRRSAPESKRQQEGPRLLQPTRQSEIPQRVVTRQDRSGLFRGIAEQVVARREQRSPRWVYDDYWGHSHCRSSFDCPYGAFGAFDAPAFYQWNSSYRTLSDNELWEICLGQRRSPFFFRRSTACRMLSSPNLWRSADAPYYLERGSSSETEEWYAEAAESEPGTGESADASPDDSLAPCDVNETLARKRAQRDCTGEPATVE